MKNSPKNIQVFGEILKKALEQPEPKGLCGIYECTKVFIYINPQQKILHKHYYALYNERMGFYDVLDKNKVIGYTNVNRFVLYTSPQIKTGGINLNLEDLKTILELCEMCNKSLYK